MKQNALKAQTDGVGEGVRVGVGVGKICWVAVGVTQGNAAFAASQLP